MEGTSSVRQVAWLLQHVVHHVVEVVSRGGLGPALPKGWGRGGRAFVSRRRLSLVGGGQLSADCGGGGGGGGRWSSAFGKKVINVHN